MRTSFGQRQTAEQHRGDHGDCVGFEQIGGHAGTVAHIVADIVRNHCRIAWIVLGNAGLDLADKIGAHICALGENSATQARKDRDQRRPECQAHQGMQVLLQWQPHGLQHSKIAGHAEQPEADHQHPGDRAAANATSIALPMPCRAASAVRTLARTETFMPI